MRKEPDYLFQKLLMLGGALLLIQGTILYVTRNLYPFYLVEIAMSLALIMTGIWMIDWEAKLYYKSLKRRIKDRDR